MNVGIIPARYGSTRFPGKPLVEIAGKSMIERVYRQCEQATGLQEVVVATDDPRIFDHVTDFGGKAVMTRADHLSGTDRVGEVAAGLPGFDRIVNIQGDEPFIDPRQIDQLCELLERPEVQIATLVKQITDPKALHNPNVVKAVLGKMRQALYFSRSPIPYFRGEADTDQWVQRHVYYKHLGIYGFRRDVLLQLIELPASALEQAESLEQLRWLEHGYAVHAAVTTLEAIAIDTPEDLGKMGGEFRV